MPSNLTPGEIIVDFAKLVAIGQFEAINSPAVLFDPFWPKLAFAIKKDVFSIKNRF